MLGFSAPRSFLITPFGSADTPASDGNALSTVKTSTLSALRPWISWTSCCDMTTSHGSLQEKPWNTPISVSPTVQSIEPVQACPADCTRQRKKYAVKKTVDPWSRQKRVGIPALLSLWQSYFTHSEPCFLQMRTVMATVLQNCWKDSCLTVLNT